MRVSRPFSLVSEVCNTDLLGLGQGFSFDRFNFVQAYFVVVHLRQFQHAHVELAGDHVGDQAGTIFADEIDLATGLKRLV